MKGSARPGCLPGEQDPATSELDLGAFSGEVAVLRSCDLFKADVILCECTGQDSPRTAVVQQGTVDTLLSYRGTLLAPKYTLEVDLHQDVMLPTGNLEP